jgi:hypothetical protein
MVKAVIKHKIEHNDTIKCMSKYAHTHTSYPSQQSTKTATQLPRRLGNTASTPRQMPLAWRNQGDSHGWCMWDVWKRRELQTWKDRLYDLGVNYNTLPKIILLKSVWRGLDSSR